MMVTQPMQSTTSAKGKIEKTKLFEDLPEKLIIFLWELYLEDDAA